MFLWGTGWELTSDNMNVKNEDFGFKAKLCEETARSVFTGSFDEGVCAPRLLTEQLHDF